MSGPAIQEFTNFQYDHWSVKMCAAAKVSGILGDGTDDTPAFVQAFAIAQNSALVTTSGVPLRVDVPRLDIGPYNCSSAGGQLALTSNFHLRGLGKPVINFTGTGIFLTNTGARNVIAENLRIVGAFVAGAFAIKHATSANGALNCHYHHLEIDNFGTNGGSTGGSAYGGGIWIASDSQGLELGPKNFYANLNVNILITSNTDSLWAHNGIHASPPAYPAGPTRGFDCSGGAGSASMTIELENMQCEGLGAMRVNGGSWVFEKVSHESLQPIVNASNAPFEFLGGQFVVEKCTANTHSVWIAATAFPPGAEITDPSGHLQKVTTAGTSGSGPTWNDSGGTTTDGTITWTDQGAGVNGEYTFYVADAIAGSSFRDNTGTGMTGFVFRVGAGAGNKYGPNVSGSGPGTLYSADYIGIVEQDPVTGTGLGYGSTNTHQDQNYSWHAPDATVASATPISLIRSTTHPLIHFDWSIDSTVGSYGASYSQTTHDGVNVIPHMVNPQGGGVALNTAFTGSSPPIQMGGASSQSGNRAAATALTGNVSTDTLTDTVAYAVAGIYTSDAASTVIGAYLTGYNGGPLGFAGTQSNHPFVVQTNSTTRISISAAGAVTIAGAFACNGSTAQASAASGGAVATTTPALASYGFTLAQATAVLTLLNNIRAALVANGIMS